MRIVKMTERLAYRRQGTDDVLELVRPGSVGLRDLRHRDKERDHPHQGHVTQHLARVQGAVC